MLIDVRGNFMSGIIDFLEHNLSVIMFGFFGMMFMAMNFVTYDLYGTDKKLAQNKQWRIKEEMLLMAGFFGGALGAVLGMKKFNHKTKKKKFWIINIAGLIWQVLLFLHFVTVVIHGYFVLIIKK